MNVENIPHMNMKNVNKSFLENDQGPKIDLFIETFCLPQRNLI